MLCCVVAGVSEGRPFRWLWWLRRVSTETPRWRGGLTGEGGGGGGERGRGAKGGEGKGGEMRGRG